MQSLMRALDPEFHRMSGNHENSGLQVSQDIVARIDHLALSDFFSVVSICDEEIGGMQFRTLKTTKQSCILAEDSLENRNVMLDARVLFVRISNGAIMGHGHTCLDAHYNYPSNAFWISDVPRTLVGEEESDHLIDLKNDQEEENRLAEQATGNSDGAVIAAMQLMSYASSTDSINTIKHVANNHENVNVKATLGIGLGKLGVILIEQKRFDLAKAALKSASTVLGDAVLNEIKLTSSQRLKIYAIIRRITAHLAHLYSMCNNLSDEFRERLTLYSQLDKEDDALQPQLIRLIQLSINLEFTSTYPALVQEFENWMKSYIADKPPLRMLAVIEQAYLDVKHSNHPIRVLAILKIISLNQTTDQSYEYFDKLFLIDPTTASWYNELPLDPKQAYILKVAKHFKAINKYPHAYRLLQNLLDVNDEILDVLKSYLHYLDTSQEFDPIGDYDFLEFLAKDGPVLKGASQFYARVATHVRKCERNLSLGTDRYCLSLELYNMAIEADPTDLEHYKNRYLLQIELSKNHEANEQLWAATENTPLIVDENRLLGLLEFIHAHQVIPSGNDNMRALIAITKSTIFGADQPSASNSPKTGNADFLSWLKSFVAL